MAREDKKYGYEAINKKNDKQKKITLENEEYYEDTHKKTDRKTKTYDIENIRHGEGKGKNKEHYEKRDIDATQEKRREEFYEKVLEKDKHSRKF